MKLSLICLILLLFPLRERGCLKLDLILLVDVSGSVSGYEPFLDYAVKAFVDGLDINENGIYAGVVTFSDHSREVCPLTPDHDVFDDKVNRFYSDGQGTDLRDGLERVKVMFEKSREDAPDMVIIISDGDVISPGETIKMAQGMNVTICGILILDHDSQPQFMQVLCGGCYLESDYKGLLAQLDRMNLCI